MWKLYLTLLANKPYTCKIEEKLLTWNIGKFSYHNVNIVSELYSLAYDSLIENLKQLNPY